jgi:predicted TIM-barrel fold metal-dependent hydrolase
MAKPVDMALRTKEVKYFYDYEADQDVLFDEQHPTEQEAKDITGAMLLGYFPQSEYTTTHTAANFAAEMDLFNYEYVCCLPIEVPIRSRHAMQTCEGCKLDPRLVHFAGVQPWPWGPRKIAQLEYLVGEGAPGLKYHPEFQIIAPDNPHSLKLFEWCAERDIPVLSHCGYTGAEPAFLRKKSEPERFRKALEGIPNLKLILAHCGIRIQDKVIDFAKQFEDQVWLDFAGQPVPLIQDACNRYNTDKLMYGSDWPFFPLAVALARALVATEDRQDLRPKLLRENAMNVIDFTRSGSGS